MKKIFLGLIFCLAVLATPAHAQIPSADVARISQNDTITGQWKFNKPVVLTPTTVSGLPAASTVSGGLAAITDGNSTSDCTVGGGSSFVICNSNGSSWTAVTGSGGGSTTFPLTVGGTVNSGGIPCFNSTTNEESSAALTLNSVLIGGGAGACITSVAGPTTPNGVPEVLINTPSGGMAGIWGPALGGVPTRASTCGSNVDTVLDTDRANYVSWSDASGCAVGLPQAGSTNFGSNFVFVGCDIGAGTATITPTTSTISYTTGSAYTSAASSLALTTGQCALIYSDNTNYFAILIASSSSSGLSGMTATQVPIAATSSTVTSSKALAGSGAGITTGPASGVTSTDFAAFSGTGGQITDSGIPDTAAGILAACTGCAPKASPTFTGTETAAPALNVPSGATLTIQSGGTLTCAGGSTCPSGGSGAPATVTLLSKTATYAGSSSDFSSGSAPPTMVEFTLAAEAQTYTLPSTAPALVSSNMPCTIIKNAATTGEYYLQILTGGSTTLDGTAYAAAPGYPLGGSKSSSIEICSDGTNYHTNAGNSGPSTNANPESVWIPMDSYPQAGGTFVVSAANTLELIPFTLHETTHVGHFYFTIHTGGAGYVCDLAIYSAAKNLLTHITSGYACTSATNDTENEAVSTALILPPGNYYLGYCGSNALVAYVGITSISYVQAGSGGIGSFFKSSTNTAGTGCSAGVAQAVIGTLGADGANGIPYWQLLP